MILPAISIQQPWPHCIFHMGKNYENRTWVLPPGKDEVPVLVHAGKKMDTHGLTILRTNGLDVPSRLQCGGIVGYAVFSRRENLIGHGQWAGRGVYNWLIIDKGELPFFPCKGSLGFFDVDYPHAVPFAIER